MSDSVEEHHAKRRAAAVDAMARGQAALAALDLEQAERWLDRARRVAGGNDAVELLLATVRLRRGGDAAILFAPLAARHDLREAWLGLARAHHRDGDAAAAASALSEALCGHVGALPTALHATADAIAAAIGAAGWCCLDGSGQVRVAPATLSFSLKLDGADLALPPPDAPWTGLYLEVVTDHGALLGSPFQLARMRRIDGFVDQADGGLAGFAWWPNHPTACPALRLSATDGSHRPIMLGQPQAPNQGQRHDRPLALKRPFTISPNELPGPAPFHVTAPDGQDLPGSPVDPLALARYVSAVTDALAGRPGATEALLSAPVPAAYVGVHRRSPSSVPPPVSIVVPVYRGTAITLACLDSLFAHSAPTTRVIVIDDAGPEPALTAALDRLAAEGRISLIRHARNRGFPAAANAGIAAAGRDDVVLLNADTLVPPDFLPRLRAAAYAAPDIGSATPLSNDATLLSYPGAHGDNPVPDAASVARLSRLAHRANRGRVIEIPTAIGFCMYLRRDCLDQIGPLREDVFAQGYGEENDFCLRARALGWRHVAAVGLFVGHVGGVSFGAARNRLLARNLATLNRLHPGYDALIAADTAGPALAEARRRIDRAVLAQRRAATPAVILITHDFGGGVQHQVNRRCDAMRADGQTPIILRPVIARPALQGTGQCQVDGGPDLPNLIYHVAREWSALVRLLAAQRPCRVELHHMLGHDPKLFDLAARLDVPCEVHLHDYAWFCPRISLVGAERRYCGEPDLAGCAACIEDAGRNTDEEIPVAALVARSARILAGAARVVAPSADTAARFARHFPDLHMEVAGWDDTSPPPARPLPPATRAQPRIVAVLGAIGIEKGYDILLACARDAAARALPLRFVVIGHTTDDARLLRTGNVFVTGDYTPDELPGLIAAEQVQIAFLPSIWPETWCFTLSEAWSAGLRVIAFDLGAPAERIRRQPGHILLPLACPPQTVNAVLLRGR